MASVAKDQPTGSKRSSGVTLGARSRARATGCSIAPPRPRGLPGDTGDLPHARPNPPSVTTARSSRGLHRPVRLGAAARRRRLGQTVGPEPRLPAVLVGGEGLSCRFRLVGIGGAGHRLDADSPAPDDDGLEVGPSRVCSLEGCHGSLRMTVFVASMNQTYVATNHPATDSRLHPLSDGKPRCTRCRTPFRTQCCEAVDARKPRPPAHVGFGVQQGQQQPLSFNATTASTLGIFRVYALSMVGGHSGGGELGCESGATNAVKLSPEPSTKLRSVAEISPVSGETPTYVVNRRSHLQERTTSGMPKPGPEPGRPTKGQRDRRPSIVHAINKAPQAISRAKNTSAGEKRSSRPLARRGPGHSRSYGRAGAPGHRAWPGNSRAGKPEGSTAPAAWR